MEYFDFEYEELKVGDMIWAKRYNSYVEKKTIPYGHEEGPFVIIKINKDNNTCLFATSNPHKEMEWNMIFYRVGRLKYGFKKNSYVNCAYDKTLTEDQYIGKITSLDDEDMEKIKKQIYVLKKSKFSNKPRIPDKDLKFKIGKGDIVLFEDKKYYIFNEDKKSFHCYELLTTEKKKGILINNTFYRFDFDNVKYITARYKCKLVSFFNTGEMEMIERFKQNSIVKSIPKNENKTLRVGALIEYNDKLFYVHDINEDDIVTMYVIHTVFDKSKKMATVLIRDGTYFTLFNDAKLDKNYIIGKGFKVRRCANEYEIEYNKNNYKCSISSRKKARKNLSNNLVDRYRSIDDFIPMVILKHIGNNKYYLILNRNGDIAELVNINDLGDSFCYELDKDCPFKYYRILPKEEFDDYVKRIEELKALTATF